MLKENGLERVNSGDQDDLKIVLMCEISANDLTHFTLGVGRDSSLAGCRTLESTACASLELLAGYGK